MGDLWERVVEIVGNFAFANSLETAEIRPEDSILDLGIDSLDRIDMELRLEERFPVSFLAEDSERIKTVGDLFAFIKKAVLDFNISRNRGPERI